MKQRKRLEQILRGNNSHLKKLVTISAFWKNDKPSGFGGMYDLDDEDICCILADMFESYIKLYREADNEDKAEQIKEYRGQLYNNKEMLKLYPGFGICLIGNVWFLESLGLIDVNNFNGVQMVWQG